MHGSDDLPVALARLVALGQSPDVNIRPVLLRVIVDLFVTKAHHAPDDIRQFEAIASHLIEQAEPETRAVIADKLSRCPSTPPALIRQLMAEEPAIARHAFAHAAVDGTSLLGAATWGSATVAAAVAERPDLPADVIEALAGRPEGEVVRALAANAAAVLPRPVFQQLVRRAREDDALAALLIAREADPIDYAPLFPLAPRAQRMAIIDAARRLELGRRQWGRLDGPTTEMLARLDHMVLAGERESFEIALSQMIGVPTSIMTALLQDEGGEVLALALAAVGASEEMAARAFILGDPRIGRSVERVHTLTRIVAALSQHAARRLIGAMTAVPLETARRRAQAVQGAPARRAEREEGPVAAEMPAARRQPAVHPSRRHG